MTGLNEDLLVEMVDSFLEPFGCDSDFDSDFFFDPEEDRVYFSIIVSERSDRLFKEYIKKEFHFNVTNIFMISLLHEVGHFFTLRNFSKKKIKAAHEEKNIIAEALEMDNSNDEIYSLYFDLDIEKAATEWAVKYYTANQKRCDDFYKAFLITLQEEYKRLGVTN